MAAATRTAGFAALVPLGPAHVHACASTGTPGVAAGGRGGRRGVASLDAASSVLHQFMQTEENEWDTLEGIAP